MRRRQLIFDHPLSARDFVDWILTPTPPGRLGGGQRHLEPLGLAVELPQIKSRRRNEQGAERRADADARLRARR
jgi:hypothetical protein